MKIVSVVLTCVLSASALSALTLSEKEAVMWALEANPDIMVSRLAIHYDSLNLEIENGAWLPGMALNASTGYRGTSTTPTLTAPGLENNASLAVTQDVPGGGVAKLSLSQTANADLDSSVTAYGTDMEFSYTQPLLNGAWGNAEPGYKVRIARLNNTTVNLQQKKAILAELSEVRTRFWTYYEQKKLLAIAEEALEFARQRYELELARYRLGQTAELDTLNAVVELLQARKNVLNAGNGVRQARKELGVRLMLAGDAVEITEEPDVSVDELPAPDTFLEMARTFDPELKIFELTRDKLEQQYRSGRNALLPTLDASFSYEYDMNGDALFADDGIERNALVALVFGYSLPLRETRLGNEQNRLSRKENEINRKRYLFELKNRVTDLVETWELERTGLGIMRKTAEAAERQLEAARTGYAQGSVSRLELLEAENTRSEAAVGYVRAQVTMKKLEIIFDEITGKLFDTFGVTL